MTDERAYLEWVPAWSSGTPFSWRTCRPAKEPALPQPAPRRSYDPSSDIDDRSTYRKRALSVCVCCVARLTRYHSRDRGLSCHHHRHRRPPGPLRLPIRRRAAAVPMTATLETPSPIGTDQIEDKYPVPAFPTHELQGPHHLGMVAEMQRRSTSSAPRKASPKRMPRRSTRTGRSITAARRSSSNGASMSRMHVHRLLDAQ